MPNIIFNFTSYTKSKQLDSELLWQWLQKNPHLPHVPLTKTVLLEPPVYHKLMQHINAGVACQFNVWKSDNPHLLQLELDELNKWGELLTAKMEKQLAIIAKCEVELKYDHVLRARINDMSKKLAAIKKTYTDSKMLALLNVNTDYKAFTRVKSKAEAELKLFSPEPIEVLRQEAIAKLTNYQAQKGEYAKKAFVLRNSITVYSAPKPKAGPRLVGRGQLSKSSLSQPTPKPKATPAPKVKQPVQAPITKTAAPSIPAPEPAPSSARKPATPATSTRTIHVDWKDIVFDDGGILVRYPVQFLNRFPLVESKKYLNAIKAHYRFRNAPLLELRLNQRTIVEVVNREVIVYYLSFLNNTCSQFDFNYESKPLTISRFQSYTKSYYRKNLPNLFASRALKYLCEIADEKSHIIPAPEVVINSAGARSIDDSFLFVLKRQGKCYIAWESTEESKATYIFQAEQHTIGQKLQIIYDYLVDNITNKRQTLIHSVSLQRQLGLVTRIMHTNFADWRLQLKAYSV